MSSSSEEDVPFYLMPVAAALGMYTLVGGIRIIYLVYANLTYDNTKKSSKKSTVTNMPPSIVLNSKPFLTLIAWVLAAAFGYAKVVASVENAMDSREHALFDPYDILSIPTSSNSTDIKRAYRDMSKLSHPDKGGSPELFQKVHQAYKALTDETAKANYEQYGHPDGPSTTKALSFALPEWLLHPQGNVAVVLILLYLGMFAYLIYVVVTWASKEDSKAQKVYTENSVAGADAAYLASKLHPDSTHLDVLLVIASTPENIMLSQQTIDKTEKLRAERMAKLNPKNSNNKAAASAQDTNSASAFDLGDDGGWAEDDVNDSEEAKAAALNEKKAEEEKAKALADLAKATAAPSDVLMEGIDEGVLGQKWVERTLEQQNMWPPPDMGILKGVTFRKNNDNTVVEALEHPAVRRNICMTMGRLNAQLLNAHPELLKAGAKQLVDQTYFKSTMEYRQRSGLLLEAALRVAIANKSYKLAKTIIETVSMFKIGTMSASDETTLAWFKDAMIKQYGPENGVPQLEVKNYKVCTPDEDEIATGDSCVVECEMERLHAESFTKQKIAVCERQGIPPQLALQTYREGWWMLVRAKRLDGEDAADDDDDESAAVTTQALASMLEAGGNADKFKQEKGENRLLSAWPMLVKNVAQKTGKVNVQFKAPDVPGKYRFFVAIKSQEFLGTDQEFTVDAEVVDVADVQRVEEEAEEDEKETEEDETKKEK